MEKCLKPSFFNEFRQRENAMNIFLECLEFIKWSKLIQVEEWPSPFLKPNKRIAEEKKNKKIYQFKSLKKSYPCVIEYFHR